MFTAIIKAIHAKFLGTNLDFAQLQTELGILWADTIYFLYTTTELSLNFVGLDPLICAILSDS